MILKGKRIFITEDNVTNRSVMQMILEQQGAIIEFERWGRETCQRLKQFEPVDIILLDLMFPDGISGLDVFDQIRALPEFNHVPIVAVSAKEVDIAMAETRAKGFHGFIPKPINRLTFAQQILAVIEGKSTWNMS